MTTTAMQIVMTQAEAAAITTRIRLLVETIAANTEKVVTLIEQAEAGEAWRALEYPSWTAYVAAEFSGSLRMLEKAERIPVVTKLAETGMSTRAIAPVVGVSKSTVDRDLSRVPSGTPAQNVIGTDGKSYVRQATFLRSGKPDARSVEEMGDAVPKVTPRRVSPVRDAYGDAVAALEKAVERLAELTTGHGDDDRHGRYGDRLHHVQVRLHDCVVMPLLRGGGDA